MKGLTGFRQAEAQDLKVVSTVQQVKLGARVFDEDGNQYTYCKVGASQVNHGLLTTSEATVANHTNIALAADAAVGAMQVSVTLGATAAVQDQYTEGYVVLNAGTGSGYRYAVKGHYAANASATLVLYLQEPLVAAVTAASTKASLYKNPCKDVIVTTTLGKNPGVSLVDLPAANFGWLQTKGLAPVLAQGAVTKDFAVIQSTTTAGAIAVQAAATDDTVGIANEALVSGEYRLVTLNIEK
jgi:hypothetical protein